VEAVVVSALVFVPAQEFLLWFLITRSEVTVVLFFCRFFGRFFFGLRRVFCCCEGSEVLGCAFTVRRAFLVLLEPQLRAEFVEMIWVALV